MVARSREAGRLELGGIGPDLHRRCRKAAVQIPTARDRPPIVEENFDGAPIGNPAEDEQALLDQPPVRGREKIPRQEMGREEAGSQNCHADGERAAPDPEQLLQLALEGVGPVGEISGKGLAQLPRRFGLRLAVRDVNDDRDRPVGRKLARPTNDIVLGFLVEIALPERKWIEAMKELSNLIDAKLNSVGWDFCGHRVPPPRLRVISGSMASINNKAA